LQATGNWQDVINDSSLNAVVIGTWPYLHKTLVLEALQAGKHVLTEARLVRESASAPHASFLYGVVIRINFHRPDCGRVEYACSVSDDDASSAAAESSVQNIPAS